MLFRPRISVIFTSKLDQSVGKLSGVDMISVALFAEFMITIKKGKKNKMSRIMPNNSKNDLVSDRLLLTIGALITQSPFACCNTLEEVKQRVEIQRIQ